MYNDATAATAGATLAATGMTSGWYIVGAIGLIIVGLALMRMVPKSEM